MRAILILSIIGLGVAVWFLKPVGIIDGEHYGHWSLVPAGATIVICFLTRNVLLALLLGVISGGLIVGKLNILDEFLLPSLGTANYAQILLVYLWALGGLLGIWNKNGGARYFAEAAAKRFIRSRRSAKMFAWFMGLVFHQGGTVSTVLTGTTVRPISDQHKVAREELAYVVDSTASPIATLIPFNAWPIYIAGLIIALPSLGSVISSEADAIQLFYSAIPFNFYALFAIAMTFLFSLDRLPLFGTPMWFAVRRVNTTGELYAPGASPLASKELTEGEVDPDYPVGSLDFLLPMATLLGFCIAPLAFDGQPMVFEGFGSALLVAIAYSILKGMPVKDVFEGAVTGIKGVTLGALILGLAVTLAMVSTRLGTSAYVIEASQQWLQGMPFILPALLMVICMIISFSIGTSFGTYAVVFPVALPLAFALVPGQELFLVMTFAAILGGAVFGDQCSPISDTTILSSLASGSDLMAHVNTQFPLALIAASLAGGLYVLLGYLLLTP